MNNRGKQLSNLEKLKNHLIYLSSIFVVKKIDSIDKNKLRKNINDTWKEVYYFLGKNKNISLLDDTFLRDHWIVLFQFTKKKGNDYIKFLLNKFSVKNIYENNINFNTEDQDILSDEEFEDDEEQYYDDQINTDTTKKLMPNDINEYVNNMCSLVKYWYYTYFPFDIEGGCSELEKIWIDKINRIGIIHFRPLIMDSISNQ